MKSVKLLLALSILTILFIHIMLKMNETKSLNEFKPTSNFREVIWIITTCDSLVGSMSDCPHRKQLSRD